MKPIKDGMTNDARWRKRHVEQRREIHRLGQARRAAAKKALASAEKTS